MDTQEPAFSETVPTSSFSVSKRYSIFAVAVLFLVSFYTGFLSIGSEMLSVMRDLDIDYEQFRFISTVSHIVFFLLALPLGILIDRVKRVRILLFSMILFAVSFALIGFCRTYEQLLIVSVFYGIFDGAISICLLSLLFDFAPRRLMYTIFAVYSLSSGVAGALSSFNPEKILNFIMQDSWRNMCWLYSAAGIAFIVLLLFLKEPQRVCGEFSENHTIGFEPKRPFLSILKSPAFLLALASGLVANAGVSAISDWAFYYSQPKHLEHYYAWIGYFIAIVVISKIAFSFLVDKLSVKSKQANLYSMATGLAVGTMFVVLFIIIRNDLFRQLSYFMFPVSISFISGVLLVFLISKAGPYYRSAMYGLFILLSGLISQGYSMISDKYVSDIHSLRVVFNLMPVLLAIGAIGFFFAARLLKRSAEKPAFNVE